MTAFRAEYGEADLLTEADFAGPELAAKTEKYASWAWRMGENPAFDLRLERRFPFGSLEVLLQVSGSVIRSASVFSDMLDPDFPAALAGRLSGCPFSSEAVRRAAEDLTPPEIARETADFLAEALASPPTAGT